MKTKHKYYREGDGYILMTGECPKGFKGVMFVVWEGDLGNLKEGVRMADQLKTLEEVDEIPGDWVAAFGHASGLDLPDVQEPPQREARTTPRGRDTSLDEFVAHSELGLEPGVAAVAAGLFDDDFPDEEVPPLTAEDQAFHNGLMIFCAVLGIAVVYLYIWKVVL
jgi:hypothetical protein